MSDIELVIKIPEKAYKILKNEGVDWLGAEHILNAVANGIPLPKGHGKLKDTDELKAKYGGWYNLCNDKSICAVETKEIDWMPTIIDADKE